MTIAPRRSRHAACIAAALLLIAGCQQGKQAGGGKDGGVAAGEVLPGSASDAMLPYDTVRSQPPLAPRSETGEDGKPAPGAKKDSARGDAAGPADATEAPQGATSAAAEPAAKPAGE